MSGRKLVVALALVVVVAVTTSVLIVQKRRAEADALRTRVTEALVRGEPGETMDALDAASPGLLDPDWAALRRVEALTLARRFKEAQVVVAEVLARRADHVEALRLRADAYTGEGYHEKALADLDRALELSPGNADVLASRALVHVNMKDNEKARADLDAAIAADDDHTMARKQRCVVLHLLEDHDQAKKDCEVALKGMATHHRDRTFTEYAYAEVIKAITKKEKELNAQFEQPAPDAGEE